MLKSGWKIITGALLILFALAGTQVQANNYVSFKGGFYITYPDDWLQVNYLTADMFLSRAGTDKSVLNYEAVFAPKTSSPFFQTDYLVLTVDSMEWLYDYQIDSVLEEMNKSFGEDIKYFPAWDSPTNLKSNEPVYDKKNRVFSVINEVISGDRLVKKNLLIKKFYDKGIANFYFYSPDSMFETSKNVFFGIVNSLKTENVQQALPKESSKVASTEPDKSKSYTNFWLPGGAGFIIIIILIIRLKKARRKKSESDIHKE